MYAAAGIAGNVFSLRTRSAPLSVGASGCIFGLLGAFAVFLKTNDDFFAARGVNVRGSLTSVLESCALNAFIGLRPGSMVDNAGHLGGLVGGAAAAYLIGPRLRRTPAGRIVDEPIIRLPGANGPAQQRTAVGATARRGRRRRRVLEAR